MTISGQSEVQQAGHCHGLCSTQKSHREEVSASHDLVSPPTCAIPPAFPIRRRKKSRRSCSARGAPQSEQTTRRSVLSENDVALNRRTLVLPSRTPSAASRRSFLLSPELTRQHVRYSSYEVIAVLAASESLSCSRRRTEVPRCPLGAGGGSAANPRSGFS